VFNIEGGCYAKAIKRQRLHSLTLLPLPLPLLLLLLLHF
jgi:hypothetical protein